MNLNNIQKSVIVGSMLGDGMLSKVQGSRNSRFEEVHGADQYDWLFWKQNLLLPISSTLKKGKTKARKNLGNNKIVDDPTREYKNCVLRTKVNTEFTKIERDWYKRDENGNYIYKLVGKTKRRIKILPIDFELDFLSLAVWFMDDGSNLPHRKAASLASMSFSLNENIILHKEIERFGIYSTLIPGPGGSGHQIYIGEKSYLDFIEIIKSTIPNIPDCMKYKIDLSDYKLSWKKSPNYWPYSDLNNNLVQKIMEDAKKKIPQREIANKYNICYKTINRLLKGKSIYNSEFNTKNNYRNTTGIYCCSFVPRRNTFLIKFNINKETISLGEYRDKKTALEISEKVRKMRDLGIVDKKEFLKIKPIRNRKWDKK